jgi:hypothetical protein
MERGRYPFTLKRIYGKKDKYGIRHKLVKKKNGRF